MRALTGGQSWSWITFTTGEGAEPLNRPRSLGPVLGYGYYSNDFCLVGGSRHGGVCGSHRRRGRRLLEGVASPTGAHSKASSRITDVRHPVAIIDSHEAKKITGASPASITARQFMEHSRD